MGLINTKNFTEEDFEIAVTQALDARNRYVQRSGFSAHQRVFGSAIRMPGCLMSDDPIDRIAVATDSSTEFKRSAEIRDGVMSVSGLVIDDIKVKPHVDGSVDVVITFILKII